MTELLLTVLALSQEKYNGPISHAIPQRLMGTYRKALKLEYIFKDDLGVYLEEEGCYTLEGVHGDRPFTLTKETV